MTLTINKKTYEAGELVAYVEKLEKENTELKEELKDANEKVVYLACNQNKDLKKENAELKEQIADVLECFVSASSGDDFEMAESAREVMETLNITCYRHGKVKSKLTKAKELIKKMSYEYQRLCLIKKETLTETEQFLKEK